MIDNIQSVRGMHDCLPDEAILWQKVEKMLINIFHSYGYNEIRFPIVEFTQLFTRSIGQVTDVVEKEMYSFNDQSGHGLTLRPEGTSGCVRASIENSLFYNRGEQRLWYIGPMFRYERPQKGRYRQFHQCSAEAFGYIGPDIDAELILITARCWKALGISQYLTLELNSIGSLLSRMTYCKRLIEFLKKQSNHLTANDIRRLNSNPLRILDSKDSSMQCLLKTAPALKDYLDKESRSHFDKLCQLLDLFKISYVINPYLVRGLDYYNRTVFEWVTNSLGNKKAVCAGGRYDDLSKQLGGKLVPAIGFSIGLERLLLLMKVVGSSFLENKIYFHIYIIYSERVFQTHAILLAELIREKLPRLRVMVDYVVVGLKKQLSKAVKSNAYFVLIVDSNFESKKTIILKDLRSGQQNMIEYNDIINSLYVLIYA